MNVPAPGQVAGKLQTVATLARRGRHPAAAARPALERGRRAAALGPDAGRRLHAPPPSRYPDDLGADRRARHADVPGGPRALQRARARARRDGIGEGDGVGDHVPQPPRLGRAPTSPAPSSAPTRCSSTPRSPARSSPTSPQREEPTAIIYDEEFARLLEEAGGGRKRFIAWHEPDAATAGDPHARRADRRRRHVRPVAAAPSRARPSILTSGTTGTPKGASRSQPQSLDPVAALLERIPLRAREQHDDRRAAVPRLGLRALHARMGLSLDGRARAQVRPRGDALADRAARVHGADRRAR